MHLQRFGVALVLAVGLCKPQSPTAPRPEFEVASIKPVNSDPRDSRPRFNCSAGGSFVASGVPLQYLIEWAFDIRTDFSVPDWAGINGERYNIEARPGEPVSHDQCKVEQVRVDGPGDGVWQRGNKVSARGWEAWMIAATLQSIPAVGRPVVDKTGLKGLFEFRLDYAVAPGEDRQDIFSALQEQLGLKLVSTRGPVQLFVLCRW